MRFVLCTDLHRFAGLAQVGDGQAAIMVLRAHQEWATQSTERGLYAVFALMRDRCPWTAPDHEHGVPPTLEEFRNGSLCAKKVRNHALRTLTDAELVLAGWVDIFNRKQVRRAAVAA